MHLAQHLCKNKEMPYVDVYPELVAIGSTVKVTFDDGSQTIGHVVKYSKELDRYGLPKLYRIDLHKIRKTNLFPRENVTLWRGGRGKYHY